MPSRTYRAFLTIVASLEISAAALFLSRPMLHTLAMYPTFQCTLKGKSYPTDTAWLIASTPTVLIAILLGTRIRTTRESIVVAIVATVAVQAYRAYLMRHLPAIVYAKKGLWRWDLTQGVTVLLFFLTLGRVIAQALRKAFTRPGDGPQAREV